MLKLLKLSKYSSTIMNKEPPENTCIFSIFLSNLYFFPSRFRPKLAIQGQKIAISFLSFSLSSLISVDNSFYYLQSHFYQFIALG